jgi:hypothetical protein
MQAALPDPEEALRRIEGAAEEQVEEEVPSTKVIEIDVKTDRGTRYQGKFLYHVPTIGEKIHVGRLKATYLPDGAAADPTATTLVDVVCYLTVCLTFNDQYKKPKWWAPMAGYDGDPYFELYRRCLAHEAKFYGRRTEHSGDEGSAGSQGESSGEGEVPVGRKVQPPPQRPEALAGDGARGD